MTYLEARAELKSLGMTGHGVINLARYAASDRPDLMASQEANGLTVFRWARDIEKLPLSKELLAACIARLTAAPFHRDGYMLR